jgi:hypothetical protein
MVLPCQESFSPSRLDWLARVGTTASADFCSHGQGYPSRPAFRASSTHGYARRSPQIRTCCVPARVPHLPKLRLPVRLHGHKSARLESSASMWFLYVTRQVLARMRRPGIVGRLTSTFAGFLPTVRHLPAVALASCYFSWAIHLVS